MLDYNIVEMLADKLRCTLTCLSVCLSVCLSDPFTFVVVCSIGPLQSFSSWTCRSSQPPFLMVCFFVILHFTFYFCFNFHSCFFFHFCCVQHRLPGLSRFGRVVASCLSHRLGVSFFVVWACRHKLNPGHLRPWIGYHRVGLQHSRDAG